MKYIKSQDSFELTRAELCDIMDFLDGIEMTYSNKKHRKEVALGWKDFRIGLYKKLGRKLYRTAKLNWRKK